jgi:hypothetical protein
MEDLNKYMEKQPNTLSTIRSMVQEITDRKENYFNLDRVKILTAAELEDNKLMTNVYHDVIERNDAVIDFIMDIKNTVFKIKLMKDQIDRNSQVGLQQVKQLDYFISLLSQIQDMMSDERSKMDRVVRYYEKTFSYYKDF